MNTVAEPSFFEVVDLGRMAYADALARQRRTHQQVLDKQIPQQLLLVEHDPVITLSGRKSAAAHLLASDDQLARLGIDLQPTDRGGDITYHGPGQLVAYPILRMTPLQLNVGRYMRLLEQAVIDTLGHFALHGFRIRKATGVWVNPTGDDAVVDLTQASKICAMGIRVQRNVTLHGLALNVRPDLSHFQTIVPCGLADASVTSLRELLGDACPTMVAVKQVLADALRRQLDRCSDRMGAGGGP